MHYSAPACRATIVWAKSPAKFFFLCLAIATLSLALQSPLLLYLGLTLATFCLQFPAIASRVAVNSWIQKMGGIRRMGALAGTLLFLAITLHGDAAHAQLFNKAEQETNSIFGQYIDAKIVTFLFGLLRVVVWISAVGFVLFAVYQAQRGEQWQPLMQNAFIVIAAIVVVEGLSSLFFGGGGTTAGK
jgi:hypothetical protein